MAIPIEHKIVISKVDNDLYPFLVLCSCLWQACSRTLEQAQYWAKGHVEAQNKAGNPVTIENQIPVEASVVERSVGSVEAAGQEAAPEPSPTATPESGSGS